MAETLRELVVALSLDSSNFSRNMRTINAQIEEAESTFRLAGAGVQNYEKTIAGTEPSCPCWDKSSHSSSGPWSSTSGRWWRRMIS